MRRREDLRLITGRGRYSADWNLLEQLHAAFLRSDRAHAELVSVDASAALAVSGIVAVFTGEDALGARYTRFPLLVHFTNRQGAMPLNPDRPVLAHGKVRFVGEAVALVVAESARQAQDALDLIQVEYRELPAVVTIADALAAGAAQIHPDVPRNVSFEWEAGDTNAVGSAFADAAHVTRIDVRTTRVIANPLETRAYIVAYDGAADAYDIYSSAQGITMLRWQFAELTGVAEHKLRFHLQDVGGSFGQRSGVYPEHAALMIAARKLRKPIKWVATRSECFMSDNHGRGIEMSGALALDSSGRFLAARYDFKCDMGAYLTPTGISGHLRNVAFGMTGVYQIAALYGSFTAGFTNAAPIAAYRGAGRPDIAYIVERLVDKAASELKMDRAELRRRNFIPRHAFPYKSMSGGVYESSDFEGCLDKALAAADWSGFEARRVAARASGKLRGIGIACVIEGTGAGRFPKDEVAIEFDAHGSMTLYTVTLASGQGHETSFTQVVADTLGVASEAVTLRASVDGKELIGNPTVGSRSMVGPGAVCKLAALKVINQARPFAAEQLNLEPSQVDYRDGAFYSHQGGPSISLQDLARSLAGRTQHPLNVIAEATVASTFPNGCHIVEIEIDCDTGVSEIISYVTSDDFGNVINHAIVEGQVHGGVTQGAGQIFGEQALYDRESGQLLAGSFSDYYMPRAGLIREIRMHEHSVPSELNVLGAKGVGESGCTASLPALANAMMDALRPLGVPELDMPFTPAKVWHAIQAARGNDAK